MTRATRGSVAQAPPRTHVPLAEASTSRPGDTLAEASRPRDFRDRAGGPPGEPDERLHLAADELRAWHAFLRSHAVVTRRLDAELSACAGLSLGDYDVLIQLAFADGRLRMHELADRVVLSRSGISRLVDRLVAAGYVRREHCAADARGAFAVLTDDGVERLRQATPTHLDGVRRVFLCHLQRGELGTLADILERLAAPPARESAAPLG